MIIGSGFIANSFAKYYSDHSRICIYAAGVANSQSVNFDEFERDRARLDLALKAHCKLEKFIYISTCSAGDPHSITTYIKQKRLFEGMVLQRPNSLIIRLPQLAGHSSNPHTLLNYFKNKISNKEIFAVQKNALRNILDIEDVVKITVQILENEIVLNGATIINIANPISVAPIEIVKIFEKLLGIMANYEVLDTGMPYEIDVKLMLKMIDPDEFRFDGGYLERVLFKYYL